MAAGPIVAALAGAAVGGASGSLLGALVGLGVPEIEAKVYEERLNKGDILVCVHVDDSGQENIAGQIFAQHESKHIAAVSESKAPE
jgi:outer membrane lipoprotein SlyB